MASTAKDNTRSTAPSQQKPDQQDSTRQREQHKPNPAQPTPQKGPTGRPERPISDVDRKVRGGDA